MLPRTNVIVVCNLLIAGCAIPAEPRFGNNHPASPQASEAPVLPTSLTLAPENSAAANSDEMPRKQTQMKSGGAMDHSHMNHSEMPGMKQDEMPGKK